MKRTINVILGIAICLCLGAGIFAEEKVMFNYQGRIKVHGSAFTGTGNFKFAIVNNTGNTSLWSNDMISVGGGEPTSPISISVTDGIFNVMVGDTDAGMSPINRTVFNHPNQIKLRIWFSDGTHGYQQLLPDQKLVNVELLGISSGTADFTIYVNGATGNDENNGLTTDTAKKTIQSAVDVLPGRLFCNVIIKIAEGVYREEVHIFGIIAEPGKTLTISGDEAWTPASPGNPVVRITGNDNETTATKIRYYGIYAQKSDNINIIGFQVDNTLGPGVVLSSGNYTFKNSKVFNCEQGVYFALNSFGYLINIITENNQKVGIHVWRNTTAEIQSCISRYNGNTGVIVDRSSCGDFFGSGNEFSNNDIYGVFVAHNSYAWFDSSTYHGNIRNNDQYGIAIRWDSFTENHTSNTFSGNTLGDLFIDTGGHTY